MRACDAVITQAREGTVPTHDEMLARNNGPAPPNPLEPVGAVTRIGQPHQGRLRGFVNRRLRPRPVSRLEDWSRDVVRSELSAMLARCEFDLPAVFGLWTARTMCQLAGLPGEMAADLQHAVDESSAAIGNASLGLDPSKTFEVRQAPARQRGGNFFVDVLVADIVDGIGTTGACAGIIKCINGPDGLTRGSKGLLRASAIAARETGVPITTYVPTTVVPASREAGFSDAALHQILVDTPARLLACAAPVPKERDHQHT